MLLDSIKMHRCVIIMSSRNEDVTRKLEVCRLHTHTQVYPWMLPNTSRDDMATGK